jgi:hypothetical protein
MPTRLTWNAFDHENGQEKDSSGPSQLSRLWLDDDLAVSRQLGIFIEEKQICVGSCPRDVFTS